MLLWTTVSSCQCLSTSVGHIGYPIRYRRPSNPSHAQLYIMTLSLRIRYFAFVGTVCQNPSSAVPVISLVNTTVNTALLRCHSPGTPRIRQLTRVGRCLGRGIADRIISLVPLSKPTARWHFTSIARRDWLRPGCGTSVWLGSIQYYSIIWPTILYRDFQAGLRYMLRRSGEFTMSISERQFYHLVVQLLSV